MWTTDTSDIIDQWRNETHNLIVALVIHLIVRRFMSVCHRMHQFIYYHKRFPGQSKFQDIPRQTRLDSFKDSRWREDKNHSQSNTSYRAAGAYLGL